MRSLIYIDTRVNGQLTNGQTISQKYEHVQIIGRTEVVKNKQETPAFAGEQIRGLRIERK